MGYRVGGGIMELGGNVLFFGERDVRGFFERIGDRVGVLGFGEYGSWCRWVYELGGLGF